MSKFQSFLELVHCKYVKTSGGHEKWTRSDLLRPIIFQTHIDPIPEFIIQNNLRVLGYKKQHFFEILEGKVEVSKKGDKMYVLTYTK
ncbi:MAG: type II toxin-antitoxin system HicA family toxin [Bacteroidetes bacterium]|nr:type II toxin-antitoxin system HicA family toxin [Bacteroidota bacterium]